MIPYFVDIAIVQKSGNPYFSAQAAIAHKIIGAAIEGKDGVEVPIPEEYLDTFLMELEEQGYFINNSPRQEGNTIFVTVHWECGGRQ